MDNFSDEDVKFSEWFFARVVEMHERAAEFDGTMSRPDEPDWTEWVGEVRLLREEQGAITRRCAAWLSAFRGIRSGAQG